MLDFHRVISLCTCYSLRMIQNCRSYGPKYACWRSNERTMLVIYANSRLE